MPKLKGVGLGSAGAAVESATGFGSYDGPVPPAGVYSGALKRLGLKTNRNGDFMINGLVEIADARSEKKRYTGCPVWFNLNVTNQGAPYLNNFLRSLGGEPAVKAFHNDATVYEAGTPDQSTTVGIVKIGTTKINGNAMKITTKIGSYQGVERAELVSFMPVGDDDEVDEDDAAEVEEVEDPFEADESEAEDADEEDADEDEAEEEDEDEEDDEEEDEELTREDELAELSLTDLKKEARAAGIKVKKADTAETLIAAIIEAEEEEDDDEDDDAESDEPPF